MPEASYRIEDKRFIIENYNWAHPFANFFPGIAGKFGVPLWAYYVSRGQGLISMGVHTKDHAILEFQSFNKALDSVGRTGFRTFLKVNGQYHEPFRRTEDPQIEQRMTLTAGEVILEEYHAGLGLVTEVLFFPLVESPVPAIVRRINFRNRSKETLSIELLDGLPRIIPFGMDRHCQRTIARHVEGMIEVAEAGGVPLFRLKQAAADVEKIEKLSGGNFYFSQANGSVLKKAHIVDPAVVFEDWSVYEVPWNFQRKSTAELLEAPQKKFNRTPCAMTAQAFELPPREGVGMTSCVGWVREDSQIERFARQAVKPDFLGLKRQAQADILNKITDNVLTVSGSSEFDEFMKQMFLDNVIRGGLPLPYETANGKSAFYVYSRQNGDLERDYHEIVLEPTYFSQGTGHYRSVNQNRRMDSWFFPDVYDYNVFLFMNLIQTDGYNPLEVTTISYRIPDMVALDKSLKERVPDNAERKQIKERLEQGFTPGQLIMFLEGSGVSRKEWERLLTMVLAHAVENEPGAVHEGFWIDHWHYNLDLIENFLMIYPDHLRDLLLERDNYTFYDNVDVLLPRDEKYVLVDGKVRQYGAVYRDPAKEKLLEARDVEATKVRTSYGKGKVYRTNLLVKLLCLAANKVAALDPQGTGIEMEADKPGWNDSMNGLPGLLGSSMGEALELEKLCGFLKESLEKVEFSQVKVFDDLHGLIKKLTPLLTKRAKAGPKGALAFWDAAHTLREKYLLQTRYGISGTEKPLTLRDINAFLDACIAVLGEISSRALRSKVFDKTGVPYTYFENQVTQFQQLGGKTKPKLNHLGYPIVKAKKFNSRPLARFLEGPVHMMRVHPELAEKVYEAVYDSPIYDSELQMFKVCESLKDETFEIGRVKAWPAGWIENESVYTHMVYKYLLETLRSGLYRQFFRDVRTCLTPFLDPEVYGRSIFENVSFIVSSAYGEAAEHGRGYQARLSGVTSEMVHMWLLMTAGRTPFFMSEDGALQLRLKPALPDWIFTTRSAGFTFRDRVRTHEIEIPKNSFAFRFVAGTLVVYRNDGRKNTYDPGTEIESHLVQYRDGTVKEIKGPLLEEKQARDVRAGKIFRIDATL